MSSAPTQHDSLVGNSGEAVKPEAVISQAGKPLPKTDTADLQKLLNLEPKTIVLAKVKGYSPWPAMVLDETILPENIKKMKPKTIRLARKTKSPVIIVPVRFFSDDTYIWIKSCDLKVLSMAEVDAFLLKKANVKKHDLLIDAYKLAKDPPDMVEFNTWGSHGPPLSDDSDEEMDTDDELEAERPKKKVLKLSIKLKTPSPAAPKTGNGNGKVTSTSTSMNPLPVKQTPAPVEMKEYVFPPFFSVNPMQNDSLEGFDSDWGVDDSGYDLENGNFIFDSEQDQIEFNEQFPRAVEIVLSLEQFQEVFKDIHRSISPQLLLKDIGDEKKILAKLRDIECLLANANTPIVAFTKSLLFRVLLVTVHQPEERFARHAIREGIHRVFNQIGLQACRITEEDMVLKSKDNTPLPSENRDEGNAVLS